jgi:hypothetical protein
VHRDEVKRSEADLERVAASSLSLSVLLRIRTGDVGQISMLLPALSVLSLRCAVVSSVLTILVETEQSKSKRLGIYSVIKDYHGIF